MAHCGGLLDADADGADRGVFDRLFGLVGEAVVLEAVNEEQSGYGERASLALTRKQTLFGGGGALEVGDLRPLEDGSERGETPLSPMPLNPRLQGMGGSRRVSTGADTEANTSGAAVASIAELRSTC